MATIDSFKNSAVHGRRRALGTESFSKVAFRGTGCYLFPFDSGFCLFRLFGVVDIGI